MGYVNTDLEQDWWAKQQHWLIQNNQKDKDALAAQNNPSLSAAQRSEKQLDSQNGWAQMGAWADGRQLQHERNLQNSAMEEKFYGHDTDRYTADAQRQGVQSVAGAIQGGMQPMAGMGGGQANGYSISDPSGQQIAHGGVLGGLIDQNHPQNQPRMQSFQRRR